MCSGYKARQNKLSTLHHGSVADRHRDMNREKYGGVGLTTPMKDSFAGYARVKLRWDVVSVSLKVMFMTLRTSIPPLDKSEGPLGIIRKL